MTTIYLFYVLIVLFGLYKYMNSAVNKDKIIYLTLFALLLAFIINSILNETKSSKPDYLLSVIVDESKPQKAKEPFGNQIRLANLPISLDSGLNQIVAMNDSIVIRNNKTSTNLSPDTFTTYQLVGLLMSSTDIGRNNVVYKSWNKNYVDNNEKKLMYNFVIRMDGTYYLLNTSYIMPNKKDKNNIKLVEEHINVLNIYNRSMQISNEHFDPVINDVNGYLFLDIHEYDGQRQHFFGVILPNDAKFLQSQVIVIANRPMEKKFTGEPLYFTIDKDAKNIEKIKIITPDGQIYRHHNKKINSIFAVVSIKNNVDDNIIKYDIGDGKCNKISLMAANMDTPYIINYANGIRGSNYYKKENNEYKAPIYIGE